MNYRIINHTENIWAVYTEDWGIYFEGTLADCYAWIKATQEGYL